MRVAAAAAMASRMGSSPLAAAHEEQVVEGEDAFDISSKNASQDHLRRWRVRLLRHYSLAQIQLLF